MSLCESDQIMDFQLTLNKRFPEEMIRRASGIIQTNATSLDLPLNGYGKGKAIYTIYSIMNHSCM